MIFLWSAPPQTGPQSLPPLGRPENCIFIKEFIRISFTKMEASVFGFLGGPASQPGQAGPGQGFPMDFQWNSMDFQWISMIFDGFQWISMNFRWIVSEFQWFSIVFQWISMIFDGFSMNFNDFHKVALLVYIYIYIDIFIYLFRSMIYIYI